MKAKTLLELLTLSTNLYMISKDEKFMSALKEMSEKGKEKLAGFTENFSDDEEEGKLMERFMHKAHEAKEELEHKVAEIVEKTYAKMNIAHVNEVNALVNTIDTLKKDLRNAEGRIADLEAKK